MATIPMRRWTAAALAATAAAACPVTAQQVGDPSGVDLPVVEHTLANGMRFLILPRPGVPTVAFVTRFDVGSVHERPGYTGIAHMLEHMLFKGTTTIGTANFDAERELYPLIDLVADSLRAARSRETPDTAWIERMDRVLGMLVDSARGFVISNEFDEILTRNGARDSNASTTYDATTYYVQLPANRARLWFVLEADRYRNPVFREFLAERDVVAEERRSRLETTGSGKLAEAFLAEAFPVHPYGAPVIGHMADIQAYSRSQVAEYFDRFYRPNNAVVAIVGDIDPDQAIRWAQDYFGPIPPGDDPPAVDAVEPPQRQERRVEVLFNAQPEMMIGWHVPDAEHDDAPALAMLASVLAGGRTSRMERRLVQDERIAQSISAYLGPGDRFPRLFVVAAQPRAPHGVDELEAAIYQEIRRLADAPPTDVELQRVRNQIEASEVRRLRSNMGLAFQIVGSEARYGDWRETFRAGSRLHQVVPADVQRVARTYFRPENRTVATLRPPESPAEERPQEDPAAGRTGGARP